MDKDQKYTLIKGYFSVEEATEILLNLYASKIRFHEARNFSLKERFGKSDTEAFQRIKELKMEMEKIKERLEKASSPKLTVSISAMIEMKFIE